MPWLLPLKPQQDRLQGRPPHTVAAELIHPLPTLVVAAAEITHLLPTAVAVVIPEAEITAAAEMLTTAAQDTELVIQAIPFLQTTETWATVS